MRANSAAAKVLVRTKGFLGGKELIDKGLTFWTLSVWNDDADMKSFRNSAAHKAAMQKLPYWCKEASYVHWIQEGIEIPAWSIASERLLQEGRLTKVRRPTANQLANTFPPIQWSRMERIFKPAEK